MRLDELFVQRHEPAQGDADQPTIVLVHGAPDRSGTFGPLLAELTDRSVVTYDRRGYGRSLAATPPTAMVDHALDLLAVVESVDGPCVVVAHSFGSNPTMLAATLRPDAFLSLGLWEPPLVWIDPWPLTTKDYNQRVADSSDPASVLEETFRAMLGDSVWESMSADNRSRRLGEAVAFQVDMATSLVAPFDFDDVDVPSLVGYGTETNGWHVEGAHWLVDHLPDATLHVVDGAGHFAHRTHPADYAEFARRAAAIVSPS